MILKISNARQAVRDRRESYVSRYSFLDRIFVPTVPISAATMVRAWVGCPCYVSTASHEP